MVADEIRVPYADHMLVPLPDELDALRVAAASDNLSDAWRTVVPPLRERPGGSVLVIGGGAQSIGLYAAGLAVHHGASVVDYMDHQIERLEIAESLGARVHPISKSRRRSQLSAIPGRDDVALEASSQGSGVRDAIRSLNPGGICTPVGYYLAPNTKVPLMHMYANDASLRIGVSSVRPVLPDVLDFVVRTGFPAEKSPRCWPTGSMPRPPMRRAPPSSCCTAHHSPSPPDNSEKQEEEPRSDNDRPHARTTLLSCLGELSVPGRRFRWRTWSGRRGWSATGASLRRPGRGGHRGQPGCPGHAVVEGGQAKHRRDGHQSLSPPRSGKRHTRRR